MQPKVIIIKLTWKALITPNACTQRAQNNFIVDNNRSTVTNKLVNQKPFILMTLLFPPGNRVAMTETMALSGNK